MRRSSRRLLGFFLISPLLAAPAAAAEKTYRDARNLLRVRPAPADAKLNNGVVDILQSYGYRTAYAEDVPFDTLNRLAELRDYYAKIMYWRSARLILGAFMHYVQNRRPAGIISLVPFNCGIDALTRIELMSIYRQLENKPPYMVIVCDQHTQRDHVVTRIEAFLDIIEGISLE